MLDPYRVTWMPNHQLEHAKLHPGRVEATLNLCLGAEI